jgi:DNA-directed RNA polymerase specialized sigma24 family protein
MHLERPKWTLHQEAFERLLRALGPERESAGEAYERLRKRLVKFFSWERCPEPEACADESLNRMARALERGEAIQKTEQYALGVARLVLLESKAHARKFAALPSELRPIASETGRTALVLTCLEHCLETLHADQRTLLIEYYRGGGQSRIEHRRQMADRMGIDLNALRNRAMRLRGRVEICVRVRREKESK